MNIFFKFVTNVFKWIFKDWKHVVFVTMLITLLFLSFKYMKLKNDFEDLNNISQDSLTVYKNKIGELYVQRKAYIAEIEDLKSTNSDLYNEIKNIKDNPIIVTKVETVTEFRDKIIKDTITIDPYGNYNFNIRYNDEWADISGTSTLDMRSMTGTVKFDRISFPNTVTIDLIDNGNHLSFIAKSDNPYCKINNLNGSVISPEKSSVIKQRFDKKWAVVLGVGPTVSVHDNNIVVLPGLQVTIGRKLFSF